MGWGNIMSISHFKKILLTLVLVLMSLPVFAEDSAPVYDIDNFPSQSADQQQQQEAPPPAANQQQPLAAPDKSEKPKSDVAKEKETDASDKPTANEEQTETTPTKRVDSLQTEVQSLRGQVEQLTHDLEKMQSQQHNTGKSAKSS